MVLHREIAQCTGTLIGSLRQHVLTAGHCLVDNSAGGSTYDKITYYPAISGGTLPFGTLNAKMVCTRFPSEFLFTCCASGQPQKSNLGDIAAQARGPQQTCVAVSRLWHLNYIESWRIPRSRVCHGR